VVGGTKGHRRALTRKIVRPVIQLADMATRKLVKVLLWEVQMASIRTTQVVEVRIRRFGDRRQCEVIVVACGKEMILKCPDFAQAVKWARLECKTYQVESGFSVELIEEPGVHSPDGRERVNYLHLVSSR